MMGEESKRCGVKSRFGARKGHHAGFGLTLWTRQANLEGRFTCTVTAFLMRLKKVQCMNRGRYSPLLSFTSLQLPSLDRDQASNQGRAHIFIPSEQFI